jgi:hypothetical protein
MKKKLSLFVAIFSMLALISPSLALALEVEITPQGTIIFYQGAVLGDSDEKPELKREEKKEEKREEKKEEKREEKKVERKEIKRVPSANKEVRIMPIKAEKMEKAQKVEKVEQQRPAEPKNYKVSVEEKRQQEFARTEEVETEDIKMQFPAPAEMRAEQKRQSEPKAEAELETERETEDTLEQSQERERIERPSALDAKINEYQQQLQEKRTEAKGKMIEIRNEVSDKKDELRMKSGEIKARAQEGAGFVVDSETNQVRVVTPSGEEKVLNHLPDEAIQRMQEMGLLQAGQGVESTLEPTIKTNEDGSLKYVVPVTKEKRIFGFFKRQVPAEVELDDTTGEVVEREQAPKTPLQRFLKIFES